MTLTAARADSAHQRGSASAWPASPPDLPPLQRKARLTPEHCHAHSTLTLRGAVTTVGTVVTFVDRQLCPAHGGIALGAVTLLAGELGMHAVRRHSRTSLLVLECHVERIDLVVEIPGVRVASFGPRARNPLGLALIGRIADDWGIEARGRGVRIWASVEGRPAGSLAATQ